MARLFSRKGDTPARSLWDRIKDVAMMDVAVLARGGVDAGSLEKLEELLLEADFGVPTTMRLVSDVQRRAERGQVKTQPEFLAALQGGIEEALRAGNSDPTLRLANEGPTVVLVLGRSEERRVGKECGRQRAE